MNVRHTSTALGGFVLAGFILLSCDQFLLVDAVVTDCDSGEPLTGVMGTLSVESENGFPSTSAESASDGTISVLSSALAYHRDHATLTLEKPGYMSMMIPLKEQPAGELEACLQAVETSSIGSGDSDKLPKR